MKKIILEMERQLPKLRTVHRVTKVFKSKRDYSRKNRRRIILEELQWITKH